MYELWYLNDAVLEYRFFQCEYKQNLYCSAYKGACLTTADFQIWKLRPFEFDSPRARRAGHDCRIRFDRARRAAADPENYPVDPDPLESNLHGELARTHGSRAGI